jgi:hypothetical protein
VRAIELVELLLKVGDKRVEGIVEARQPEHDGEADLSGLSFVVSESRHPVLAGDRHRGPRRVVGVMEAEK